MSDSAKLLRQRIRHRMAEKGLDGKTTAERAGMKPAQLSAFLANEDAGATLAFLDRISMALEIDPWVLISGVSKASRKPTVEESLAVIQDTLKAQDQRIRELEGQVSNTGAGPNLTKLQQDILTAFSALDENKARQFIAAVNLVASGDDDEGVNALKNRKKLS